MRYDKGRKDASRSRIMEVAAQRFRSDGIAASGLASIMSDAGMTNGAFYPHFQSKADLVRESIASALETQSRQLQEALAAGGLELAMAMYLSSEHRDHPETGCASAALLPEIARQPAETRHLYTEGLMKLVRQLAEDMPPHTRDPEGVALGIFAALIGALQLARALEGTELSDRILAAGADAARTLIQQRQGGEVS
ncbi:TetR/AcrR family transcriptional regulator [Mesorhizobium erdmanii]|uniref:TetR/AcrR family transcriptional regulator n=1 Tax=Mesorhizobium erdmanii TaxID=1777866 RepID=A0A6M7UJZ8_9HYPH|nr:MULTISPECIES: TetR/AcrR family transcriptional regulator [Mesorhizobium]OBQ73344.1 TetR family transcriptional regulator [Mesorhizobium loti]QKC76460.1 TetR/AcrR family transcriptional regulator [Mesorhizobium erdmanii]